MKINFKKQAMKSQHLIILTVFFAFLASIVFEGFSGHELFLVFLAVSLQYVFSKFRKLYAKLVSVERMREKLSCVFPTYFKKISIVLCVTPFLAGYNFYLGAVVVAMSGMAFVKPCINLVLRAYKSRRLVEAEKNEFCSLEVKVVVYVSGLENVAYQINQWIPVLERFNESVAVIVRERSIFEGMVETNVPVFYARTSHDLEFYLAAAGSVRTVLYPANPMKNAQALRHFHLNHCFINHGESDKAVNQSKLLMAYDKILVGGPLAERRLRSAGLPLRSDHIVFVGRPQAEMLLDKVDKPGQIKTILYAPTWEGFVDDVNYSSVTESGFYAIKKVVEERGYKVIVKPHPYTGFRKGENKYWLEMLEGMCAKEDVEFLDKMMPIHEAMNRCDALVTDISSVLNEFLVTQKPVFLFNVKGLERECLFEDFPSSRAAYVVDIDSDLSNMVNDVASCDTLFECRQEVKKDSLSDFPEGAEKRFINVVENL